MKTKIAALAVVLNIFAVAQTPTGTPPLPTPATTAPQVQNLANFAWYRGGNDGTGPAGLNNIFGTSAIFNSPVFVQTNGGNRLKFFHSAFAASLQGYMGSLTNPLPGNNLTRIGINRDGTNPIMTPLSLLNLGYDAYGTAGGNRSWQDLGIMYSMGSDNLYMGVRQKSPTDATGRTSIVSNPTDDNDAVISWGDNVDNHLAFIFHSPLGNPYPYNGTDYGREVMRMNAYGNVGIGPVFFDNAEPQNMLHINNDGTNPAYLQISNGTTGQTATDGFQFGIDGPSGVGNITQYEQVDMRLNFTSGGSTLTSVYIKPATGRVGIFAPAPTNRFQITTTTGDFNFGSANGSSGLRLSNMPSTGVPITNPGLGVLSVDNSGNVIYVDRGPNNANNGCSVSGGFVQLGDIASGFPFAVLLNDREVPMATNDIYFTGHSDDNIILGADPGMLGTVTTKLRVDAINEPTNDHAIYAVVKTTRVGGCTAIEGTASSTVTNNENIGVRGLAEFGERTIGMMGTAGDNPFTTGMSMGRAKSIGVLGVSERAAESNFHYGLEGYAANSNQSNFGCNLTAMSTNLVSNNVGAYAVADQGNLAAGIWGVGQRGLNNYGVYGYVPGLANLSINAGCVNRGIYGATIGSSSGGAVDNWAGYFDGDVYITGTAFYTGFTPILSDKKFKTHIDTIYNALSIIRQLEPKTYFYDTTNKYRINFSGKKQYGFISQEVYKILPELIDDVNKAPVRDSAGKEIAPGVSYKALRYDAFFAILMKGVQEQQNKIDSLVKVTTKQDSINKAMQKREDGIINSQQTMQKQMDALAAQIRECCSKQSTGSINDTKNQSTASATDVTLNNNDIIVLEQNVPNPFAEQTTINFNIPSSVTKAQLIFNTSSGSIIQTVDIKTRGRGKVNVFASDLSNGLYHYTLIADGKVIDSKKMVKE